MHCRNCQQVIEKGATYCGNCGQPVRQLTAAHDRPSARVPSYALAAPGQHAGETKALLSFLFGIIGIIGALFVAIFGLIFGLVGVIMGTMARSSTKRGLSTVGIILSSLAIAAGLAVWVYTYNSYGAPVHGQVSPISQVK